MECLSWFPACSVMIPVRIVATISFTTYQTETTLQLPVSNREMQFTCEAKRREKYRKDRQVCNHFIPIYFCRSPVFLFICKAYTYDVKLNFHRERELVGSYVLGLPDR